MIVTNKILDISRIDGNNYRISLSLDNWNLSKVVTDRELQQLVDSINRVRGLSQIMDLFKCTEKQANKLRSCWGEDGTRPDSDCKDCQFKRKECFKCQFVCMSPLERAMFLGFRKRGIDVVLQRRIRKDGTYYDYPEDIDKETILTIPDFYIEGKHNKVCVYADGVSYHYKDESKIIKDRTIDIDLQNLGYKVVRYLGEQIRNNLDDVIDSVMRSVNETTYSEDKHVTTPENVGFCIRCGKQIPFDLDKPYCLDCYLGWQSDGGYVNYPEKFCHKCGKEKRGIYFMHPLDYDCYTQLQ